MHIVLPNTKMTSLTIGLISVFLIVGCTAKQHRRVEQSGFLGDYSQLTEKKRMKPYMCTSILKPIAENTPKSL